MSPVLSLLLAPLLLAFATAAPVIEERAAANPTVSIASGTIIGTATAVSNQPEVTGLANSYLGIPFAQSPPVRFAPPTSPKAWSSPLVAQTLPPACLQQFGSGSTGAEEQAFFNNPGLPAPAESEDCLYLNVFAPQGANSSNLKPVMFWLFGGNLQFGTASLAYYNGSSLAVNHDTVVVATNYRTNFFGFPNSPELAAGMQNPGLLDQRFALQWVQENIKQFGGDPDKVTLFGESAGGFSVKQLLALPPSPLPYRAAIMESEATLATGSGTANYEGVVEHFNCETAASPLACLRNVSGSDLLAYNTAQNSGWFPIADNKTYVGYNSLPSIQAGTFADVPILIGTNKDEGRVFAELFGLNSNYTSLADSILAATGLNIAPIETALRAVYGTNITEDPYILASQVLTDLSFTCPAQSLASAIQKAGRQSIWRYRYDGVFPNVGFFPNPGAYHTTEIPEVWGTYPNPDALGYATPTQIALSKYMQGVWAGFAKDASIPWAKLGSNHSVELGLLGGAGAPSGEQTVPLSTADAPCTLIDPIIIADGMAY